MNNDIYHGNFENWKDVVSSFSPDDLDRPEPSEVYYASYDIDGYEGWAVVLWRDKRKYYFLNGSHCSCYGLEEAGFHPDEFTSKKVFIEFLKKLGPHSYGLTDEIKDAILKKLNK
jgi:hypothetical protein